METLVPAYHKSGRKRQEPSSSKDERVRSTDQQRCSLHRGQASKPDRKPGETAQRLDEILPAPPEKLWTTEEVCQFFELGPTTIFLLIRLHGLPVYRIGRRNRFDPREVWQWVQVWRERQSL